jgi:hypothetical protein
MTTRLEEYTIEEQRCCAFGGGGEKDSMQRILIKKCFYFRLKSVKWFTTGTRNSLQDVSKSQMMFGQVWKWLRQQSKDFYVAGFDALVKRCDKCINAAGGYVAK